MNLDHLSQLLRNLPEFERLIKDLREKRRLQARLCLPDQALPFLAAAIYGRLGKTVLLVTAHAEAARRRFEQAKLWLPEADVPLFFPEADLLGSGSSADPVANAERLKVMALAVRL